MYTIVLLEVNYKIIFETPLNFALYSANNVCNDGEMDWTIEHFIKLIKLWWSVLII